MKNNRDGGLRERMVYAELPGLPYLRGKDDDVLKARFETHSEHTVILLRSLDAKTRNFNIGIHGGAELCDFLGCHNPW